MEGGPNGNINGDHKRKVLAWYMLFTWSLLSHRYARLFYFCIFQKKLQKYIFGFRFYSSIPLPTARQVGGRDLYINNKKNLRSGHWREPAAPCRAAGPLPGSQGMNRKQMSLWIHIEHPVKTFPYGLKTPL